MHMAASCWSAQGRPAYLGSQSPKVSMTLLEDLLELIVVKGPCSSRSGKSDVSMLCNGAVVMALSSQACS